MDRIGEIVAGLPGNPDPEPVQGDAEQLQEMNESEPRGLIGSARRRR